MITDPDGTFSCCCLIRRSSPPDIDRTGLFRDDGILGIWIGHASATLPLIS
jgi:hypothetical protein